MNYETFCSNVRIRLDYLHIEYTRLPSQYEMYKNTIGLIFRAENAKEAQSVLEAYAYLTKNYKKVAKVMNDKKWVALNEAHFAEGRVSLKRSINKNLIYVTNYLSKTVHVLSVDDTEYRQLEYRKPKEKIDFTYESKFEDGEYYIYSKSGLRYPIAKYSIIKDRKLFFIRIEILKENSDHTEISEVALRHL